MSEDTNRVGLEVKAALLASAIRNRSRLITFISLLIFTVLGFGVVAIYSYRLEANNLKGFAILCLCAFACLAIGVILGFLFGIPRVLQSDSYLARVNEEQKLNQPYEQPNATPQQSYRQQVNTNLEQISDWVTKIFVGIGLIQLQNVPELINRSSSYIASAFINSQDSKVFAAALVIYFPIVGFLIGYILTRLFLASQFWRADVRTTR
jgi:hypothetical protein